MRMTFRKWFVLVLVIILILVVSLLRYFAMPLNDPIWKDIDIAESYICDSNYAISNKLIKSIPIGENTVLVCSLGNFTHRRVCATLHYLHTDKQIVSLVVTNPALGKYETFVKSFASIDTAQGRKDVSLKKDTISSK